MDHSQLKTDQQATEFFEQLQPGQIAPVLFDLIPDVIFWVKDEKGRFVFFNNEMLASSPVETREELLGKSDHEIYTADIASIFRSDDLTVMNEEEPVKNKSELVPNGTGGVEWRETTKIPLYAKNGDIVGTAGISRRMGISEGRPGPSQHREVSAIVGAIYKCVDQEIRVVEIAKAANISMSTLERIFKEHMGTTPKRFILQAKLSTACERIISTKMSVKEVGMSVGYQDHANFTRAFRKLMGMSPTEYRLKYSSKPKRKSS